MNAAPILSVLDKLEEKYPCGHPIRHDGKEGIIAGYQTGTSEKPKVIIRFQDGSEKRVEVKLSVD